MDTFHSYFSHSFGKYGLMLLFIEARWWIVTCHIYIYILYSHFFPQKPWSREGFIQLLEAVEDIQDETDAFTEPIVVHCADGASKSGLYCACAMVCEVIREEDEVDVFHTIKHLKNRRKQFVSSYVSSF